jgi:arsenate reductase
LSSLLEGQRRGILFVCPRNDSLSQMAEGFARFLCPADLAVFSAGCQPQDLAAQTIRAMKEVGIDVSGYKSKAIGDVPLDHIAIAIVLCEHEELPGLPKRVEIMDWPLADPLADASASDEEKFASVRNARDRVRELVSALF